MKIIIFLVTVLFYVSHLNAQGYKYLNIVLKDKSCISYEVDNSTAYITFNDLCMRVNNVDFYLENIDKYYVSDENNSTTSISNTTKSLNKIVGNNLYISSSQQGILSLYDINGKNIYKRKLNGKESVIDISTLRTGTYIIKINKDTFKFTKR